MVEKVSLPRNWTAETDKNRNYKISPSSTQGTTGSNPIPTEPFGKVVSQYMDTL